MSDWAHTLEVKWSPLCHSFRPLLPDVRRVDIQLYHIAIGVIEVNGFGHLVIVRVDLVASRYSFASRSSSMWLPILKATWKSPGESSGASGALSPTAFMAKS